MSTKKIDYAAIAKAFRKMAEGLRLALTPVDDLSPEDREKRAENIARARYRNRIEDERRAGQRFVRDCAAQARKELGLDR